MILRFFIVAVLFYLLYRMVRRIFLPAGAGKTVKPLSGKADQPCRAEDLIEDPYCHTYVPISEAHRWERNGTPLYFCSLSCLEQYKRQEKNMNKENA